MTARKFRADGSEVRARKPRGDALAALKRVPGTRVFRSVRHPGSYLVSVQASFADLRSAREFARALDVLKSEAALEGLSFSRRLLAVLSRPARGGKR